MGLSIFFMYYTNVFFPILYTTAITSRMGINTNIRKDNDFILKLAQDTKTHSKS